MPSWTIPHSQDEQGRLLSRAKGYGGQPAKNERQERELRRCDASGDQHQSVSSVQSNQTFQGVPRQERVVSSTETPINLHGRAWTSRYQGLYSRLADADLITGSVNCTSKSSISARVEDQLGLLQEVVPSNSNHFGSRASNMPAPKEAWIDAAQCTSEESRAESLEK